MTNLIYLYPRDPKVSSVRLQYVIEGGSFAEELGTLLGGDLITRVRWSRRVSSVEGDWVEKLSRGNWVIGNGDLEL